MINWQAVAAFSLLGGALIWLIWNSGFHYGRYVGSKEARRYLRKSVVARLDDD